MNNKFNMLFNIFGILFLAAIVMFFIKPMLGIITLVCAIVLNIYLQIKFPTEMKKFLEKTQKKAVQNKTFNVLYIDGIKFFDNNSDVKIEFLPDSINITNKENRCENIKYIDIENTNILTEIEQTQKDKSVVIRAVVGGLLLGGVGAIVGGLSAVNPTYEKNKKYYLQIKTKSGIDCVFTAKTNILTDIKNEVLKYV
ncbi:hypothetical protein IKE67_08630 [bacterium]|nr:hypothetical protein [bacterium]